MAAPASNAAVADSACQYPGHEGVLFSDARTEVMTWRADDGTLGLLFHGSEREYMDRYACAPAACRFCAIPVCDYPYLKMECTTVQGKLQLCLGRSLPLLL